MKKEKEKDILKYFYNTLPKFSDGRIDYSGSKEAVVVNVFVMYEKELLLLKRSERVGNYKGCWNVVAGYFDELKSPEEKALEELEEETGILQNNILKIRALPCFKLNDPKIKKVFYVFTVLVQLKEKLEVELDWEHTDFEWINPLNINRFKAIYGLEENIKRLISFF